MANADPQKPEPSRPFAERPFAERAFDVAARLAAVFPPETAHRLTIRALASGLAPGLSVRSDPRLATRVATLSFANPLGLAAGFDKNAEAPNAALGLGFGFVEVGAVTPRPQPGNARPRAFRLPADRAVINRYGFNNDGAARIGARLSKRRRVGVLGVNLGANKDSEDRVGDYEALLAALDGLADFFTVNVSSPNTPGLRALQGREALAGLLARVEAARRRMNAPAPLFLKIAPDLDDEDKADVAAAFSASAFDGLVVSNTTLARPDALTSPHRGEAGGLSGAPLFGPSTKLLAEFRRALGPARPLIGVGGVASARDAYEKILCGASLVQLYTALVFEGPGLAARIVRELPSLLAADGFDDISSAVGKKI